MSAGSVLIPSELPAVTTTIYGEIVTANAEAVRLLNVSERHLRRKSLLLFLDDRATWELALRGFRRSDPPIRRAVLVRPRDRRAKRLIALLSMSGDTLQWLFLSDPRRTPRN